MSQNYQISEYLYEISKASFSYIHFVAVKYRSLQLLA